MTGIERSLTSERNILSVLCFFCCGELESPRARRPLLTSFFFFCFFVEIECDERGGGLGAKAHRATEGSTRMGRRARSASQRTTVNTTAADDKTGRTSSC